MDTNIWVMPIPIHGYLYILLPTLKFHINTDTKSILVSIEHYCLRKLIKGVDQFLMFPYFLNIKVKNVRQAWAHVN